MFDYLTPDYQPTWAAYLEHFCLRRAAECIAELSDGYDVAGVEWCSAPVIHYRGNFWWATAAGGVTTALAIIAWLVEHFHK